MMPVSLQPVDGVAAKLGNRFVVVMLADAAGIRDPRRWSPRSTSGRCA